MAVTYTIGTVTIGGTEQTLQAGSVTLADNLTSCTAPQFPACNFLYWDGVTPSVKATASPTLALAPGCVVLAYATTKGGAVATLVPAGQTIATPPSGSSLRLPLCNALLTQGCQRSTGSLSGY